MTRGNISLLILTGLFIGLIVGVSLSYGKTEPALYVPSGEPSDYIDRSVSVESSVSDGKVNINTAGPDELQSLPGIGPVKAEAILEYREQNGFFLNKEEIINVNGIGEGTYNKIAQLITVGE